MDRNVVLQLKCNLGTFGCGKQIEEGSDRLKHKAQILPRSTMLRRFYLGIQLSRPPLSRQHPCSAYCQSHW